MAVDAYMPSGIVSPSNAETEGWSKGKREKSLVKYRTRVQAAKKHRESEGYDATWTRLRDIYRLRMLNPGVKDDQIAVAITFATINVIGPSVAISHPKITVTSRDEHTVNEAIITEAVVNYWWRHNHIKPDFRRAVKDFLIFGHGWLKVGWRYEEQERDLTDLELEDHSNAMNSQMDEYAMQSPELAHLLPSPDEVHVLLPESTNETTEDAPFVERISPFDVFVDPEATCLEDAKWIAQRVVRPLEDVKEDERYNKKIRRNIESDGSVKWFNEDQKRLMPEDAGRVTIWEYYDLVDEHVCIFADKQNESYLVDPQPFPYPYGQPFVMLRNYDVPDQFYPIGEIEAIEPLQDELNATRSTMVGIRKMDVAKWLYKDSSFDQKGLDALISQAAGTAIPVKDETPLSEAIIPLSRNDSNAQFYTQHSELVEADIDRVTGVNEYMRGAQPEVRRTATEASMIQDAANARSADKLDIIEGAVSEVARRLVMLAQTFMTSEQVARVVGDDGKEVWAKYTREDITGEFHFEVEGGSTQPLNDTMRRQQSTQLLTTLGPFIASGIVNVPALLTEVLRDGFNIKNPEKFINAPPIDPATGQPAQQVDPATGQPMQQAIPGADQGTPPGNPGTPPGEASPLGPPGTPPGANVPAPQGP